MASKAEEIRQSMQDFDFNMEGGLVNETVSKKAPNTLLIVKIANNFEADFLLNLCHRKKVNTLDIEVCAKYDSVIKPLGFMELTFDNIMKIHEYNDNIKIGVLQNKEFKTLQPEQVICLS